MYCSIFRFLCNFCRSLFVLFPLATVLSILWFMVSDYPQIHSNMEDSYADFSSIRVFYFLFKESWITFSQNRFWVYSYSSWDVSFLVSETCNFCRSLFVLFPLATVLSILWFMVSDYPWFLVTLLVSSNYSWKNCLAFISWVNWKITEVSDTRKETSQLE
jgi:hypothetical protein